jgi:hypothetical protein
MCVFVSKLVSFVSASAVSARREVRLTPQPGTHRQNPATGRIPNCPASSTDSDCSAPAAVVIMVTVFLSFVLNPDPILKGFAIGLSVAILPDAMIVRLVIVTAAMVLLGEWNWWLPRRLRWLPRVDLSDERAGVTAPATGPLSPSRRRPTECPSHRRARFGPYGLICELRGTLYLMWSVWGSPGERRATAVRGREDGHHRAAHRA